LFFPQADWLCFFFSLSRVPAVVAEEEVAADAEMEGAAGAMEVAGGAAVVEVVADSSIARARRHVS
jgi:hypothetical protein